MRAPTSEIKLTILDPHAAITAKEIFLSSCNAFIRATAKDSALSKELVNAMSSRPADFLQIAGNRISKLTGCYLFECHCEDVFSRPTQGNDMRKEIANHIIAEAILRQKSIGTIYISIIGSGLLADTSFLIAGLIQAGIQRVDFDLIDSIYADTEMREDKKTTANLRKTDPTKHPTQLSETILTEFVIRDFLHLLSFCFRANVKYIPNKDNSSSEVGEIFTDFEKKHNISCRYADPSIVITLAFYGMLEGYKPTIYQTRIVHEVDFDASNGDELVEDAFVRLPPGSVLFSAIKSRGNTPAFIEKRVRKLDTLFNSNAGEADGCQPPEGFEFKDGRTVKM